MEWSFPSLLTCPQNLSLQSRHCITCLAYIYSARVSQRWCMMRLISTWSWGMCVWVYILYQLYPHISPMLAGSVQGFAGRQWPEDACIFIWECGGVARGWRVRWWKFSESKLWFDQTCSTSIPPLQRRTHNPHSQVDHGRCGWVLGGQSSLGMYIWKMNVFQLMYACLFL